MEIDFKLNKYCVDKIIKKKLNKKKEIQKTITNIMNKQSLV